MLFEPKVISLKNGTTCTLRPVETSDAEAMIAYLREVSSETPFLLRNGDEITYTLEQEEEIIRRRMEHPRELMMVAEVDGVMAGNCGVVSVGEARRVRHRCRFAIGIKQRFWHLGIGTAMLDLACSLAKEAGYEQMELEVIDGNDRARTLYEACGFTAIGRIPQSIKYDDGTCADEIMMVKIL